MTEQRATPEKPGTTEKPGATERRATTGKPATTAERAMTAKRALDVTVGTLLLLALSPLVVGTALSVALGGGGGTGGLLRRRTVAGLDGRPFTMLTFRTKSPLAALPLLLHVVTGRMSLVGPCPLAPTHRECAGEGRRRLSVRPGLTGPWQISGRSDLPWEERELLDLHYVDHHWLGMDLLVLARTLPAVRRRRAARFA
ncbi:sugar transferase [Streptomyces litmocidini]|uniref:sugar transferase n=1 Tax=Streptomyces litmocidini TaxID=67318 RepID=UPI0033E2B8D9